MTLIKYMFKCFYTLAVVHTALCLFRRTNIDMRASQIFDRRVRLSRKFLEKINIYLQIYIYTNIHIYT